VYWEILETGLTNCLLYGTDCHDCMIWIIAHDIIYCQPKLEARECECGEVKWCMYVGTDEVCKHKACPLPFLPSRKVWNLQLLGLFLVQSCSMVSHSHILEDWEQDWCNVGITRVISYSWLQVIGRQYRYRFMGRKGNCWRGSNCLLCSMVFHSCKRSVIRLSMSSLSTGSSQISL